MSSTDPSPEGPAPDLASDVRALSPRPNLEYERKQAKQLLDQLKAGDTEALARLRRHKPDSSGIVQLSDAQFTIAREYGFTSWPRLVDYFETLTRHEISGDRERHSSLTSLESWARTLQSEHKDRRVWSAQYLAAYVPRFFGRTVDQVLDSEVTSDDARLATARLYRYPSWEVMVADVKAHVPEPKADDAWAAYNSPSLRASRALRDEDIADAEKMVSSNPDTLSPGSALAHDVVLREIKEPTAATRRAYDWLAARMDLQPTLNKMLLGHMRMKPEHVLRLFELGADPNWMPPNGYTVLEHAIARSWSGGAVDLIAQRVQPRPGFWISAGLGDAQAVSRFFEADGVLTVEARSNRPDFTAMCAIPLPTNPSPSDEVIIWEAFLLATFNERYAVLDVLLDRGFPVDYVGWGQPMTHFAVSEGRVELLEYFIKRGANLDLKGWRPHISARELAEQHALNRHPLPNAEKILEICGGRDLETLRREHEEKHAKRVMQTAPQVEKAFDYAKQDAVAQRLHAVGQENLFIGLLREAGLTVAILSDAGVDLAQLRASLVGRLDVRTIDVPAEMTANPEVSAILLDARTTAEQRKHEMLTPLHVFKALIQRASRPVVEMIEAAGGSKEKVLAKAERSLADF